MKNSLGREPMRWSFVHEVADLKSQLADERDAHEKEARRLHQRPKDADDN